MQRPHSNGQSGVIAKHRRTSGVNYLDFMARSRDVMRCPAREDDPIDKTVIDGRFCWGSLEPDDRARPSP